MITNLKLSNLKSFKNSNEIRLDNLSLFCGANSSGKSSILQSLLMLSQTFSARATSNSIVLNGYLTRLGSFEDIKSHHSDSDEIGIGLQLRVNDPKLWHDNIDTIKIDLNFGTKRKQSVGEESLHPPLRSIKIVVRHGFGDERGEELIHVEPRHETYTSGIREYQFNYKIHELQTAELENLHKEYPNYEILGAIGTLFPTGLLLKYDHNRKIAPLVLAAACGKNRRTLLGQPAVDISDKELPADFFAQITSKIVTERKNLISTIENSKIFQQFIKNEKISSKKAITKIHDDILNTTFILNGDTIPPYFTERRYTKLNEWSDFLGALDEQPRQALVEFIDKHRVDLQDTWYNATPEDIQVTSHQLSFFVQANKLLRNDFPKSVKYLRPLRNEPSAVYPFMDQEIGTNVGLKGEYTAAVLHANKGKKIRYPKPSLSATHEFSWAASTASLQDACHEWLIYLGVVNRVVTTDKGKLGYELQVRISEGERSQDLTHVGVGVSQVLPILVMCLLAEQDNILILEQPELHLHPKVQSKLCDFFISLTEFGRQCLVETHSEYLINRLRLRIAQSNQSELESRSPVYFIEKSDGASTIRNVEINRFGVVQDWPVDFFDQSDREIEAILLAAAKKEAGERTQKTNPVIVRTRRNANSDQR
jgi:predicted ATPase